MVLPLWRRRCWRIPERVDASVMVYLPLSSYSLRKRRRSCFCCFVCPFTYLSVGIPRAMYIIHEKSDENYNHIHELCELTKPLFPGEISGHVESLYWLCNTLIPLLLYHRNSHLCFPEIRFDFSIFMSLGSPGVSSTIRNKVSQH